MITAAVGFLIICVVGILLYEYYTTHVAQTYLHTLQTHTTQLHKILNDLATTTNNKVFADPTSDEVNKKNLLLVRGINEQTSSELSSYSLYAKSLPELKMASYFGPYKKAKVKQRLATNIVSQTREVIHTYQDTINYLVALNDAQVLYEKKNNELNAVSIVSSLDPKLVSQDVDELKDTLSKLSALEAPNRLLVSKNGMVDVLNQTIQAYENVVLALRNSSESCLDDAFKVIEQQSKRYDLEIKKQAEEELKSSAIVDDVNDLPTKTSLLLSIKN